MPCLPRSEQPSVFLERRLRRRIAGQIVHFTGVALQIESLPGVRIAGEARRRPCQHGSDKGAALHIHWSGTLRPCSPQTKLEIVGLMSEGNELTAPSTLTSPGESAQRDSDFDRGLARCRSPSLENQTVSRRLHGAGVQLGRSDFFLPVFIESRESIHVHRS
jgi:hypothetical protein